MSPARAKPRDSGPATATSTATSTETAIALGRSLYEALRYVAAWRGRRVVIKFGGSAMAAGQLGTLIDDVVALHTAGVEPVLVHGGGPEISQRLAELGHEARFIDGLRVTDERTMAVVESVLAGSANQRLVELLETAGARSCGLSGHQGILYARPHPNRALGRVGEVERVDTGPIESALGAGQVPVIAPLGAGPDGLPYNVNADSAAAALAGALGAEKFLLLTDVAGVMRPVERGGKEERVLISELTPKGARALIEDGVVGAGMIPKVEAALSALERGVRRAHILAADREHGLLVELFTETGIGTMITERGHVGEAREAARSPNQRKRRSS